MSDRLLLDTVYVQALLNSKDQYHAKANDLFSRVRKASLVLITEAVLLEIGNALAKVEHRQSAATLIKGWYAGADPNIRVVPLNTQLIKRALDLFEKHSDKTWSLTDCISFVVMSDNQTEQAVTTDQHFIQAGYRALMVDA